MVKLKEIFELVKSEIDNYRIEFKSDTVVRIKYDNEKKAIEEMEFLKIVGSTEKGIRLSNGLLLTKGYLFSYHHKKNLRVLILRKTYSVKLLKLKVTFLKS